MRSHLLLFPVALFLLSGALDARDHVLTIGGGYSPAGNQVSLERNVLFFEKLRAEKLPEGTPHDLYFADGTSPHPDLQFRPEGAEVPRAHLLMAGLFGSEKNLTNHYRNNVLEGVRDISSPAALERWFREEGSKLEAGDRLILYETSHLFAPLLPGGISTPGSGCGIAGRWTLPVWRAFLPACRRA